MVLQEKTKIENMIYEIRGKQVMLDSDLAKLYQVETKRINEAVRRNISKFPERISFILNDYESLNLRSQNATSSLKGNHGGNRYNPRAFTETGVYMLATVLKSNEAVQVTLNIMDAFILMKKYISSNLIEKNFFKDQIIKNTEDIKLLKESFKKFEEKKLTNEIYFEGQIYDAYSKIKDIFETAKEELIIVDGYADKTVLDMIRYLKINVTLIIRKRNKILTNLDIQKYQSQYNNLIVKQTDIFHDRYFIIDKRIIYHCGTSINYAGSKTFSINLLEDNLIKNNLIDYVYNNF